MAFNSVRASSGSVKVSVILSAWNAAATIDEAIQSVLAQEGVSFELLVGDDASADGTWGRIQSYRFDPRLRAWRFGTHRGAAAVLNSLIARARGRYLSICDADDIMESENLRRLSRLLDRDKRIGAAYGRWGRIGSCPSSQLPGKHLARWKEIWDCLWNPVPHGGAMFRKRLVLLVGGYRPSFRCYYDHDLALRLAEITRFRFLKGRRTYVRRMRPDSLTRQPEAIQEQLQIRRDAVLRRYGVRACW